MAAGRCLDDGASSGLPMRPLVLVGSLWALALSQSPEIRRGAAECPCLSPTSASWTQAQNTVLNFTSVTGVPATYGLDGCQPYDENFTSWFTDCGEAHAPEFCALSWCFVDEDVCKATRMCEGTIEPDCRDRPRVPSQSWARLTTYPLLYSYETCGYADSYTDIASGERSANWTFALVPLVNRPWSFFDEAVGEPIGIITDLIIGSLPRLNSNYVYMDGATPQSLALYADSGSWDACVHDIAIGAVDLCLGDFWITQDRLLHTSFLPSLYQDLFWLVVKTDLGSQTLSELLSQPFLPFAWALWGWMFLFVICAGILLAFAEHRRNLDDYPDGRGLVSLVKGVYYSAMSTLSGGPIHGPKTLPGRLITIGIAFFAIVSLSSYTANMATVLISRSRSTGVSDLGVALAQGKVVALSQVAYELLVAEYSGLDDAGKKLIVPYGSEAKMVHAGEADVAVIAESTLHNMYAGYTVEDDCADGPPDGESESYFRSYCPLIENGDLDLHRDCSLERAGAMALAMVNVAVPASRTHADSVSWAVEALIGEGYYQTLQSRYAAYTPAEHPICVKSELASDQLPPGAFAGCFGVAIIFVGSGSCLALARRWGRKVHKHHGSKLEQLGVPGEMAEVIGRTLSGKPKRTASGQSTDEKSSAEDASVTLEPYAVVPDMTESCSSEVASLQAEVKRLRRELKHERSVDGVHAEVKRLREDLAVLAGLRQAEPTPNGASDVRLPLPSLDGQDTAPAPPALNGGVSDRVVRTC